MSDLTAQLNTAQREAVTHGEGPLLVLAGPGSGKTTVIVRRIQYLIDRMHVPPEQILVITFTKDAAMSMQERFNSQSEKVLPVSFGTFHSIFYHIIRQSSQSHAANRFQLLTETQKRGLLIPILKEIKKRADGNCYTPDNMSSDAGEILSAISFYKNTGEEAGAVRKLSAEWKPYFQEIRQSYGELVRKQGGLDFDDMVYECGQLLERDREARDYWQGRFSHILIDEFQDINPMQYRVVKLLTGSPYNVFAVGDDDQAIYGFRGANPDCLRRFEEEFRAKKVILDVNYRSVGEIVRASSQVIGENRHRYTKELKAVTEGENVRGAPVSILHFQERGEQAVYLKGQIAEFLKAYPGKSCAVLFRTNAYMQSFAAGLTREGIAYSMREKSRNIYEHFVVRDVMAYLQLAAGDRRRSLFLQVMNRPARYLRREALAEGETVDFEKLKSWYREAGGPRRLEYLESIDRMQVQLKAMKGMPPYLAVQYLCKSVGYESWLRGQSGGAGTEKRQEWMEILEWLKEDAKGYESTAEWLEAQRNYSEKAGEGRPGKNPGAAPEKNAVQLMTMHGAKGLEFDKVWIPDCNEKNFPHGNMPDQETVEEERRIFYVGMTRAKTNLELLWLTGTKERPRVMSRFLNSIANAYSSSSSSSSMSSSNSQLSRYSSKASKAFSYSSSSSI